MSAYLFGTEGICSEPFVTVSTNDTYFDSGYSRCALIAKPESNGINIVIKSEIGANSADGYWVQWKFYIPTDNVTAGWRVPICKVWDASGNVSAAITPSTTNGKVNASVYNSAQTPGTTLASDYFGYGSLMSCAFHVYTADSTIMGDFYLDGELHVSTELVSSTNLGLKRVRFHSGRLEANNPSYDAYVSEVIIATHDIRGARVKTKPLTGDGYHSDFTGAYTNISTPTINSSAIVSNTVGHTSTYTVGAESSVSITAVALNGLVTSDATKDLQGVLRLGGTDYFSPDLGIAEGFASYSAIWTENPATSAPWSTLSSIEAGFKVVA